MRWLALLLVLVAACGKPVAENQLVEIKRADLVIGVEISGELKAVDSTDIKPPALDIWNFKIAAMADDGAEVKANEPILSFDASEQMRDLETKLNEVEAAKRTVEKQQADIALARREEALAIATAEATLRKSALKTDAPGDLTATVNRKVLELDAKAATIALELAKNKAAAQQHADTAALSSLKQKLAYTAARAAELQGNIAKLDIGAPRDGTVVYPVSWQGEKKKVGDGAWRMETVLQVVSLDHMQGKGDVDEVDIAKVAPGQVVALQLDALPDVQLAGKVSELARRVHAKSNTDPSHVVGVDLTLEPTKSPLRPGMRFRGQVETERIPNVIQIPSDAVFVTPAGPVAYRQRGRELEAVRLTLGRRNATSVEVTAGLAAGDRVSRVDPLKKSK